MSFENWNRFLTNTIAELKQEQNKGTKRNNRKSVCTKPRIKETAEISGFVEAENNKTCTNMNGSRNI